MMIRRLLSLVSVALFAGLLAFGRSPAAGAPGAEGPPAVPADTEVLARGPLHEAFARPTTTQSAPGPVVPREPPEPIEEALPEMKPAGLYQAWVPGYWAWDAEAGEYLWVSGFWRRVPPGRTWVPGSWQKAEGGWRWTSGH